MESLAETTFLERMKFKAIRFGNAVLDTHFMQAFLANAKDKSPDAFKETVRELIDNHKNKNKKGNI